MARSHNIYIVAIEGTPRVAFTVKHECLSYLASFVPFVEPKFMQVAVYRDGIPTLGAKLWDAAEYLATEGKA